MDVLTHFVYQLDIRHQSGLSRFVAEFHILEPHLDVMISFHIHDFSMHNLLPFNTRTMAHHLQLSGNMPREQNVSIQPVQIQADICAIIGHQAKANQHTGRLISCPICPQFQGQRVLLQHGDRHVEIAFRGVCNLIDIETAALGRQLQHIAENSCSCKKLIQLNLHNTTFLHMYFLLPGRLSLVQLYNTFRKMQPGASYFLAPY